MSQSPAQPPAAPVHSDALSANLARTAVGVVIPPEHLVLLEVVAGRPGLEAQTGEMLREVHHRYVGWPQALDDLHRRAMGDFARYDAHPRGPEGLAVFCDLYAKAVSEGPSPVQMDAARRWLYFLTKVVTDSTDGSLSRNLPSVGTALARFGEVLGSMPSLMIAMSPHLRRLAGALVAREGSAEALEGALRILVHSLEQVYLSFGEGDDPADWFAGVAPGTELPAAFERICHRRIAALLEQVRLVGSAPPLARTDALLALPDAGELARAHLDAARAVRGEAGGPGGPLDELHWLLEVLGDPDLESVHEMALRQVKRCSSLLLTDGDPAGRAQVVREVFALLHREAFRYQLTVHGLIEQIGRDVMASGDGELAAVVVDEILATDFDYPDFGGFTSEWGVRVNPGHLRSIRTYLRVIEADPVLARPLLAALVVHLRLGGVFVSDTDLFPKDISSLLGRNVAPVYLYVKQLLRLFPAYHNEIGAEGALREVSTRLDELEGRRDHLFHFLRKQSHVECNSEMVVFTEEIIRFCATGDPEPLRRYVPPELFAELMARPGRVELRAVLGQLTDGGVGLEDLMEYAPEELASRLALVHGCDPIAVEETGLLFRVRSEIARKYRLDAGDAVERLRVFRAIERERVDLLEKDLRQGRHESALDGLLGILESLKAVIQRPGPVQAIEDIYRKRHIAAGIPSMYGSYREERFEAMGLSLRLEALAAAVAERAIADATLLPLDDERLKRIAAWLRLLLRALRIDGFRAQGLTHCASILDEALGTAGVTDAQYLNIFSLASRNLETLIQARILSVYEEPAGIVIGRMLDRGVLTGPEGASRDEAVLAISEGLFRDLIAESFGLQRLDALIGRVLRAVEDQRRAAPRLRTGGERPRPPAPEIVWIDDEADQACGIITLGNKGFMLRRMRRLGFPVPEGFILTTAFVRDRFAKADPRNPDPALVGRIAAEVGRLEQRTGARLGDAANPLLLSVRGGAPISMPGMLETFLNVGMNVEIAEGLAARPGRAWAAWDAFRRLLQFWGMSYGLDRDLFDALIADAKQRYGASKKAQLRPDWMREVALRYQALLDDHGVPLLTDPLAQLLACIVLVGRSWDSQAARVYRREVRIAEEWATAAVVQEMVFGNLGPRSGSGVVLTRHPMYETQGVQLYGDFVVQAQGDDVVAGLVETFPVSEAQRRALPVDSQLSLERDFPAIYAGLVEMAGALVIEQGLNHQELEFTFESERLEDLFVLQTRDAVTTTPGVVTAFLPTPELDAARVAAGIGVGGGALSGRVAHTQEELDEVGRRYPGESRVLLRRDTVPDDIPLAVQVDGLVTAIGGATSHAAVAAKRLGKTCVVGCRPFAVGAPGMPSRFGDHLVRAGDLLSINGIDGSVYLGSHPTTEVVVRGRAQQ